jgi:hypothetical protein
MAVTVGQTIGEAQYTTLRSGINLVMGTPTGTGTAAAGYNQATTAPAVSPGDKITAANWDALRSDVTKAYNHQVGSNPTLTNVNIATGITKAIHDEIETVVNFVKNASNRFTIASTNSSLTGASYKKLGIWNGTQIHDVQFTWANANAVKGFFNAGGSIIINTNLGYSGSEAKTLDWQSMLNKPILITANDVIKLGTWTGGTITSDGYYDITTSARYILEDTGTNPYSENDYQIEVRAITNGLRFRAILRDDDTGDQTGSGPAVDEDVQGQTYGVAQYYLPDGTVDAASPTISYGSSNTFVTDA